MIKITEDNIEKEFIWSFPQVSRDDDICDIYNAIIT